MPRKPRIYNWYVEPIGAHTNKVIADRLGDKAAENIVAGKEVKGGRKPDLYLIDGRFAFALTLSRVSEGLTFQLYAQEGNGEIRPREIRKRRTKRPGGTRRTQRPTAA